MFVYTIAIGLLIYFFAKLLNALYFNNNPAGKFILLLISVLMFVLLFVTFFVLKIYLHAQLETSMGMNLEQKDFFSFSQSLLGSILFYYFINKSVKAKKGSSDFEKIEPKL
jgi:hypothetical protein